MRLPTALSVAGAFLLLGVPQTAAATSVAYVDQGAVWLSSLDGSQRVKLADPVVNGAGETEPYLDVAQADNGRILAVRNVPGRISRFSSYRVWEPDGTSAVQGPLTAPNGWTVYVYPLGLDLSADGTFVSYGYSNTTSCCPIQFGTGTYARLADGNTLDPIDLPGHEWPTMVGRRLVTASGSTNEVQDTDAAPLGNAFTPWLDFAATGLDPKRTDVAATGRLAAVELDERGGGPEVEGRIAVLGIAAPGGAIAAPPDCFLPAMGAASAPSLSQDATRIAWQDDGGVKVAGTPVSADDPCVLPSPPVVISPTGRFPSIGGADVARFLPPAVPPAGAGSGGGEGPQGSAGGTPPGPAATTGPGAAATGPGAASPVGSTTPGLGVTVPTRLALTALGRRSGVGLRVTAPAAGSVTVVGTVPAARVRRRGAPVVVVRGSARAVRRGVVTVRVRLTPTGRRNVRRLRGARVTLRIGQGARRVTRATTLW